MKTILKILLAVLVINACVQGGRSAWRHLEFKDAVDQEARFGSSKTPSQLRDRLIQLGAEHGVTLAPEDVTVEKRGVQTYVALTYREGIPVVPAVYVYQRSFAFTLLVEPLHMLTPDER